jgi:uncharacterized protein (TIGR02678 family)
VPSDHHPHAALELRTCARHLVQRPLTCKEHGPDLFRLIRRHEAELDRWFTQRLGYRLHVNADTARLFKDGFVPERRPLVTATPRAFHPLEYVLLALVLAATVAGPAVVSLRDLVERVRSAAVEAGITLEDSPTTRRAVVAVLQWMIDVGLASELHERVEAYAGDESADAVLKIRPDRIALLPLPALAGASSAGELLARAERRSAMRQWMRCRLVEEPVLYRADLSDAEWSELRRRLGEEERLLDEMFGFVLEARAEGVAAIDPSGTLAQRRFPSGGTLGHAALLLIAKLHEQAAASFDWEDIVRGVGELAEAHRRRWAGDLVDAPERLARQVTELLVDMRLAAWAPAAGAGEVTANAHADAPLARAARSKNAVFSLLPAAARFLPSRADDTDDDAGTRQESLW